MVTFSLNIIITLLKANYMLIYYCNMFHLILYNSKIVDTRNDTI
jgi:hypothetical protein